MIRKAYSSDIPLLNHISLASKKYWDYPEEYFSVWKKELTITEEYHRNNTIFVYAEGKSVYGYYSLVVIDKEFRYKREVLDSGLWLDHMFVTPEMMGRGIGTKLFMHCVGLMKENRWNTLKILSDPHAEGFYRKQGCRYKKEIPSSIEGRTTPLLEFSL